MVVFEKKERRKEQMKENILSDLCRNAKMEQA